MDNVDTENLVPLPYPNGPEDAAWFATEHEAHPTSEAFPCPEAITGRKAP